MSLQQRNKTSGILETVAGFTNVDSILSSTSKNAIMNKTVYNALAQKIEKTVTDLVNYYDTSQVYNKTEIRQLIGAINTLTIAVVASLPTTDISTTTIYLVGPASGTNKYDEYVYVNSTWVQIGDTTIDLSQYVTSANLTTILQSYYTKTAVNALLDSYYTQTEVNTLLDDKQDTLQYDDTPTAASTNMVKSGAIYSALDLRQPKELETPLTIGGVEETEVESALDALNEAVEKNSNKAVYKNNIILSTDKELYLVREPLKVEGASDYIRDKIIGGTVAWNQMAKEINSTNYESAQATVSYSNGVCTFTATSRWGSIRNNTSNNPITAIEGHVYLIHADIKASNPSDLRFGLGDPGYYMNEGVVVAGIIEDNTYHTACTIGKYTKATGATSVRLQVGDFAASGWNPIEVKNMYIADLTLMFGSTIAGYLKDLEAATTGAGYAKLQEWGFFTNNYYAYNAGELISVNSNGHRIYGKNLIEETWNGYNLGSQGEISVSSDFSLHIAKVNKRYSYTASRNGEKITSIQVLGYFESKPTTSSYTYNRNRTLNSNGTFTPDIDGYVIMRTYNDNASYQIQVGEEVTTYEPYSAVTYPLVCSDLRGIPKLTSSNKLYYDGDIYAADGTVTRKYGMVDMGTLTWTYDSTYTRFTAYVNGLAPAPTIRSLQGICSKYECLYHGEEFDANWDNKFYFVGGSTPGVFFHDTDYTTASAFTTAVSGTYLVYPLATSTTENAAAFADPQSLEGATLEEYLDTRTVPMPPGHETQYMGPDYEGDTLTLPSKPAANGTYVLSNTVSGNTEALGWTQGGLFEDITDQVSYGDGYSSTDFSYRVYKCGNLIMVYLITNLATGFAIPSASWGVSVLLQGLPIGKEHDFFGVSGYSTANKIPYVITFTNYGTLRIKKMQSGTATESTGIPYQAITLSCICKGN